MCICCLLLFVVRVRRLLFVGCCSLLDVSCLLVAACCSLLLFFVVRCLLFVVRFRLLLRVVVWCWCVGCCLL